MADNIVGGLFGIMPEDVAAQRMAALDQQAQAFGRMSSNEAYKTLGYKAGNVLGQGLFGVNDPQMERVRQRQQMAQGIDFNDPESLLQAAQRANQMGDSPAAQELYAKAVSLKQAQATLGRTQAETTKALRETDPEKVRIATAFANNTTKPGTQEWKDAFTEALNNQITPRGGSTSVTLQQQQLIAKLEDDISSDKPIDEKELNQARFILGKMKQPRQIIDSQTGEVVLVPGVNVNELAPNLASKLFSGAPQQGVQPPMAGQAPIAPQPQGAPIQPAPYAVTTLPTPRSEAEKAKELSSIKSSISSINDDLINVDEAIKRTTPWATGWANYIFGGMPESEAKDLNKIVSSLNASKIFTELAKLKEQSKTGASGLGSVTKPELDALENKLRALDPQTGSFPSDLQYVKTKWKELRDKMQLKAQGLTPTSSPRTSPKSDDDIVMWHMQNDPAAIGKTKEQVAAGLRKAKMIGG